MICRITIKHLQDLNSRPEIPYLARLSFPIGSMYGTFTYIYHINQPNVGKYTIHDSLGLEITINLAAWRRRGASLRIAEIPSCANRLVSTHLIHYETTSNLGCVSPQFLRKLPKQCL